MLSARQPNFSGQPVDIATFIADAFSGYHFELESVQSQVKDKVIADANAVGSDSTKALELLIYLSTEMQASYERQSFFPAFFKTSSFGGILRDIRERCYLAYKDIPEFEGACSQRIGALLSAKNQALKKLRNQIAFDDVCAADYGSYGSEPSPQQVARKESLKLEIKALEDLQTFVNTQAAPSPGSR
jgi:hypothetical protein